MASNAARILFVEDDPTLADTICEWFTGVGFSMVSATSGSEALYACEKTHPDIVILDLGLPDQDGIDVLKKIRNKGDRTPILIVTARDTVTQKVVALNTGADDYLTKPFELPELEARVRAILRRKYGTLESQLRLGTVRVEPSEKAMYVEDQRVSLSRSECLILTQLLETAGKVVRRSTILKYLEENGEPPTDSSLEVSIHRLRKKLAAGKINLRTVRGLGYLLELSRGL